MYHIKIRIIFLFILNYLFFIVKLFKKIKVCLCTIGKKENLYAREYVNYYKNLGINKIFIYDNNDEKDETFDLVLKDYIDAGFVEIIDARGKLSLQVKAMEECRKNNYNKFDWLLFFDMDEFLYLRNYSNINDFLKKKVFDKCQKIQLIQVKLNFLKYYLNNK